MATRRRPSSRTSSTASTVRPPTARTEPVLNPATGEQIATAPLSGEQDVDAAVRGGAAGVRRVVARRRRASARWRCCGSPTRSRSTATRSRELESLNVGKPIEAMRDDEMPFMVDNLRFFAGAARCLEGRAAGEYMEGYTSMIRARAGRRGRPDRAVELPADDGDLEDRAGARRGQHGRPEALRATPLTTLRLAELAAEHLPKGVLNVIFGHGEPAGAALVRHPDVDDGLATGDVATGKEIARTAADTLKRVHLELGGKAPVIVFDDADLESGVEAIKAPATSTPARTARRRRACSRARRSTTTSCPGSPSGRVAEGRRHAVGGHRDGPARLRAPARARGGLSRARARPTPRPSPAGPSPSGTASSSSRPSSPASSRATR